MNNIPKMYFVKQGVLKISLKKENSRPIELANELRNKLYLYF